MLQRVFSVFFLIFTPAILSAEDNNLAYIQDYLDFAAYSEGAISTEQVEELGEQHFVFVDTRNTDQFEKGHIPGALHVEWREILQRQDEIPQDKPVILYCETGLLSSKAQFMLQLAGFDNVKVLWGGYLVWSARQTFEEALLNRK